MHRRRQVLHIEVGGGEVENIGGREGRKGGGGKLFTGC